MSVVVRDPEYKNDTDINDTFQLPPLSTDTTDRG